jgi:hypothetical protein
MVAHARLMESTATFAIVKLRGRALCARNTCRRVVRATARMEVLATRQRRPCPLASVPRASRARCVKLRLICAIIRQIRASTAVSAYRISPQFAATRVSVSPDLREHAASRPSTSASRIPARTDSATILSTASIACATLVTVARCVISKRARV